MRLVLLQKKVLDRGLFHIAATGFQHGRAPTERSAAVSKTSRSKVTRRAQQMLLSSVLRDFFKKLLPNRAFTSTSQQTELSVRKPTLNLTTDVHWHCRRNGPRRKRSGKRHRH